jgi:hypothetical protein
MKTGGRLGKYARRNKLELLVIAIVCFAFVLVFSYLPLFGWRYAFYDFKPGLRLADSKFAGFKYFKIAFTQKLALISFLPFPFKLLLTAEFSSLASPPVSSPLFLFLVALEHGLDALQ